jgi:hypothetical protein
MFRGLKLLHGLRKSATVVFGFTEQLAGMWACGLLPETTVSRFEASLLLSQPPWPATRSCSVAVKSDRLPPTTGGVL